METKQEQIVTERAGPGGREQGYEQQDLGSPSRLADSADRNRQEPWLTYSGDTEQHARGLGWLSIGFGLAEVMVPHSLARFLGTRNHGILFRLMGLREIATGVGILSQRRPAEWLWARVGGDIIDLLFLGKAFNSERAKPNNIAITTIMVGGITALDAHYAQQLSRSNRAETDGTVKGHEDNPDQSSTRRALPLLARFAEFTAIHEKSRMCRSNRAENLAMDGEGTGRSQREVGRRDYRRSVQRIYRVALARRRRSGELRLGALRGCAGWTWHPSQRRDRVSPAGGRSWRDGCQDLRPSARAGGGSGLAQV